MNNNDYYTIRIALCGLKYIACFPALSSGKRAKKLAGDEPVLGTFTKW